MTQQASSSAACLRFGGFEFDERRGELRGSDGSCVPLRPRSEALLRLFLLEPGRLIRREELTASLWPSTVVTDDSLVQCVRELRSALNDQGQQIIRTVRGRGYRWELPVERVLALESSQHKGQALSPKMPDPQASPERARVWVVGLVVLGVALGAFFIAQILQVSRSEQPSRTTAPRVNVDQEIANRRASAVLAFVDKAGAKTDSTLGDDLADLVADRMLHAGVRVIGRTAMAPQNPPAPDFVRIGQEHGVRFVVAGRIAREGRMIRVDTYLTEIASGAVFRLWEGQFKSDEDVMRSDYGEAVVRALIARYFEVEIGRAMLPGHEKNPVDLLALAWRDLDRGNTAGLESARKRFESVVNADPASEEASYGLGLAYLAQFYCICSTSPREKLDLAEKTLRRALELAPDNPRSLAAWAEILLLRQRPDEALRVWRNALEISPDDQNTHVRMASALVKQGQWAEGQVHLSQVTALRPYQLRRQQWVLQTLADAAFSQGDDEEAYTVLKNWTAEFPSSGIPYFMMAAIDALHGRDDAASANLAVHRQMLPLSTISYVVLTYPSTDPAFLVQRARLVSGLRKAGLPEGDR